MAKSTFTQTLVIPILVGVCSALAILLWAPEWINQSDRSATSATQTANAPVVSSFADSVDRAAPAVVNIYTSRTVRRQVHPLLSDPFIQRFLGNRFEPTERIQSSLGSGVIMTSDGYVLTNNHVVKDADRIQVSLKDGRDAEAMLVGSDPEADLALLKVEMEQLPFVELASSETLRVGDIVLAIGNPFGIGQTVTMGIVSATGRNKLGINAYEDYIQTDAAINRGNSGGALVNAQGQLVGINTAIISESGGSEGIGFAIPAEVAKRALDDIAQHGVIIRGWLGIEVQEANPQLLNRLALPEQLRGLIVTGLYEDGPAHESGLTVGDIIVQINDMDASDAHQAMTQIAALRPGDEIYIEYIRGGRKESTRAIAGRRQSQVVTN
jgi:serine protease DegS